jgi:hypothetical protein
MILTFYQLNYFIFPAARSRTATLLRLHPNYLRTIQSSLEKLLQYTQTFCM